jgi:hypothetical protein
MALNKLAAWGTAPAVKPARPGLATIVQEGFKSVGDRCGGGSSNGCPVEVGKALACLAQVRDVLLQAGPGSAAQLRQQLADAWAAPTVQQAHAHLQQQDPALAKLFQQQFRPLDQKLFGRPHLQRVAELLALENTLTQRVK